MADKEVDWDSVHRTNFESAAFWDVHWISKARDLYETARKLEPDIIRVWESYRSRAKREPGSLKADHYQGPYFMLLAYATENLLKAAAVARDGARYKREFRTTLKFPQELKGHDLVWLAKFVDLAFTLEEEDLLRRLTRSAIWYGRYPVPLDYKDMSGNKQFSDGDEYSLSWFGVNDIERLNTFINTLPSRLRLYERYWDHTA
jgi:hypothetical protein